MWNRAGVCLLLLVADTSARPFSEECDPSVESLAKEYAALHPNTEPNRNPEYGEHFEGDIILQETKEPRGERNPLNALTNSTRLWPNGIIYYEIKNGSFTTDEIGYFEKGISELVELTKVNGKYCIQILPRQSENDFVYVQNIPECSSELGFVGGIQNLSLGPGCLRQGTIMHEFLHAFGFEHEHTRYDRDDWITINFCNIIPDEKYNFIKNTPPQFDLLGTPYDYKSVMHYSRYAFAVNDSIPTIIPKDLNAKIGQRERLSELDIERVQILYGCLKQADSRFFKHIDLRGIPKRN